ncbi:DUF397 domain-containing protein [Streptomyces sp. SID4919]|uniref:DUF397 domain-containing protein n=1 Tax=unclassified Streptomyces TaxID=2593676 RepID=UPI000823AE50|nr:MULTISPECIES: DUF397 domain-containing protein [unclassified Streptomyces]MYY11136.1 DUF397 domain-containing protein [Streptomyces sp. SID4919]SCK15786.1 protein of unknown function [Streptomyces sp. AmelKG-E11A]
MEHEIRWTKSSLCNGDTQCLEIAATPDGMLLRESGTPGTVVTTTPEKLRAFLLGIKAGEFDHFTETPSER